MSLFAGRIFSASFEAVAVGAAMDMFELVAAAGFPLEIIAIRLGQYSSVTSAMRRMNVRRGDTVSGSGGTSPTIRKRGTTTDGAAQTTVEANNTTLATGGAVYETFIYNDLNGLLYHPLPEERIWVAGGERLCVRMVTGPSPSIDMSGTIVWAEHG